METIASKVYIQIDSAGRIIRCDGGYTLSNIKDVSSWILIDEGFGDRYNLCQSNYFAGGLYTDDGYCRYKYADSSCVLRSATEIQEERETRPQNPTLESRVDNLETASDEIILMMADLIGGE